MKFKDFIYSYKEEKKHNVVKILGIKIKFKKRLDLYINRKEKNYDVGIISFNINTSMYNFGAALHSYAFQKYLDKFGISNVIINYSREAITGNYTWNKINAHYEEKNYKEIFNDILVYFRIMIKKRKFLHFFKKHCEITKYQYNKFTIPQLKTINRFVCETDVTWAKFLQGGYDEVFMCDLPCMKNKDNVAYSIDFGSGEWGKGKKKNLKHYAQNFKYLSIRNIFKLDYFKENVGRNDAEITIDPVFLIDKEDYSPIIKTPKINKEYVLVYNCQENNPDMVKNAKKYAKEKNLEIVIINCYTVNITDNDVLNPTPIGIEDFLGLIQNCKYFFTNSYHGICFAIIFNVQFFAFSRIANSEKILTVLNLFDLQSRYVQNSIIPTEKIDYTNMDLKIKNKRKSSEEFIYKSLIEGKEECKR